MAIWTTSPIAPTATGTGTDATAVQTFTVPSPAVELIAARVHVVAEAPAPAEGVCGVVAFGGQDWKHVPFEFFSEIGGTHLGAINGNAYAVEPRWWRANLPVKAGSTIGVSYEPLDALADNGEWFIDCVWSSVRTGLPAVQRLCSRETSTATATGASITIPDPTSIVDFSFALVPGGVLVADEEVTARLTVNCGALNEIQQMSLGSAVHGIEATSGQSWTSLMKREIDIGLKSNPAVFTSSISVTSSPSNAGAYAYSIGYVPAVVAQV